MAPFDPYNLSELSEIEKIQRDIEKEIERDLTLRDSTLRDLTLKESTPPQAKAFDAIDPSTMPTISFVEDEILAPNDVFYRETIKRDIAKNDTIKPHSYRRMIVALLLICTLGTGTFGLGIGFGIVFMQNRAEIEQLSSAALDEDILPIIGGARHIFGSDGTTPVQEGSLADVVRLVDPSVVRISASLPSQPPLPFFGQGNNDLRRLGGSGIIFEVDSERVFIVTSHHVIRGAATVNVSIMDLEPIPARPVGNNPLADLAIISVDLADVRQLGIRELAIATFGDSDAMQVGDVVLAIGNAMGEGNSTTSGIISAGEKELIVEERPMRVLQTDAAINRGNSGGPLVNKQGEVIGINTALAAVDHYAIEGMGFSIPSNVVKPIIEQIMTQVPRPFLGIYGRDVSEQVAFDAGIPPIGVHIQSVFDGTGAQFAGLRDGDIITSFNGRTILNMGQLQEEIAASEIGDTVEVMIIRGRSHLVLQVTLGESVVDSF